MSSLELKDLIDEKQMELNSLSETLTERQLVMQAKIDKILAQYYESNSELIEGIDLLASDILNMKEELRTKVTKFFEENRDISFMRDDIARRIIKTYEYDEEQAIKWAIKENRSNVLSIKKAEFNKIRNEAKFVKKVDNISITIKFKN